MAIGLTDLNKRRSSKTGSAKTESARSPIQKSPSRESTASVSQKPSSSQGLNSSKSFRSRTARPWSQNHLQPNTRSRKRETTSDIVMNDDWASVQTEPLFWLDPVGHSRLTLLQERLSEIEERIHDGICGPWRALLRFCS